MRIIAKTEDDLDLYVHSQSVMDTALVINHKCGFGLDDDIVWWCAIMHDVGKANPLWLETVRKKQYDVICRHEISSVLFSNAIPEKIRDVVAYTILSHHKSVIGETRSIYDLYNLLPFDLYNNHIGDIEKWGRNVKEYLWLHYGVKTEIPSHDECVSILDRYASKALENPVGWSEYRGLLMNADHFASCFPKDTERITILDKCFTSPDVSAFSPVSKKYPLSYKTVSSNVRHIICTAPCGSGKTNVGMRFAKGRIFYMLPYQASINAMYQRIRSMVNKEEILVTLDHGSYRSLTYLDNLTKDMADMTGQSIKVLTPYQAMSVLFCLKGYEMVLMDMQGQTVVLDEIHTYSGISQRCVLSLIEVLSKIGCRIIVLSATIPTILKNKIISILEPDGIEEISLTNDELDMYDKHIVHTSDSFDNAIREIVSLYEQNRKVLIVRNQKGLARDYYRELKKIIPSNDIMLIHSSYERSRREELEAMLMKMDRQDKGCIVVSTQVVEVSLDISFDVMYTDCADIMSLIQRFGRINRRPTENGKYGSVHVIKTNKRTCLPYDYEICEKTFSALSTLNGKLLRQTEIQGIIDDVHSEDETISGEMTRPFDDEGKWKMRKYTHCTNKSISEELNFSGAVGVLASKKDSYLKTRDKSIEIPLTDGKELYLLSNELQGVYEIPDELYSNDEGYIKQRSSNN